MIAFVTELDKENYNQFLNNDLVLIDIYATWCNPCKTIAPIIDEISNDNQGILSVGKLDADINKELLSNLNVRNIPTLILFKTGKEVGRLVGAMSKQKIMEMIEPHLS